MTDSTPQRLLAAAADLFAQQGYADTTIQQIATAASANIAAVNYHFGSKPELFAEVVSRAIRGVAGPPPPLSTEPDADPEVELRRFVRWFLGHSAQAERVPKYIRLGPDLFQLPAPVLDLIVERLIRPEIDKLQAVVRRMLPGVSAWELRSAMLAVMGQCVIYRIGTPIAFRLFPSIKLDTEAEDIAGFITEFCLHAIRGMRARMDANATHDD